MISRAFGGAGGWSRWIGGVVRAVAAVVVIAAAGCREPAVSRCGDGRLDPEEQCDDGNRVGGDGCSRDCLTEAFCGNATIEAGEECDDGNDRGGDGCSTFCQLERGCGNGVLDWGEGCDDDNLRDGDGCSATCADEDGIPTCGNGILERGEGCDDGNLSRGDGCDDLCQVERGCGDGQLSPGEACDDGNRTNGDGCTSNCRVEFTCGDEACEAAGGETCEKCPTDCCPRCGDGVLDTFDPSEGWADEECDDGNNDPGDGCSPGCVDEDGRRVCGNGILETFAGEAEECDDGNVDAGDGCSADCRWEFTCDNGECEVGNGETCQRCPADCCPSCGNGAIDVGEVCDRGSLSGLTCRDFCFDGGILGCTAWCEYDFAGCVGVGAVCGDAIVECDEECEGPDLRGADCATLGFAPGTLLCSTSCTFDTSACGPPLVQFEQDFEDAASVAGWIFSGDWEWGSPRGVANEPAAAYSGIRLIGTTLGGNYSGGARFDTHRAVSPPIDLFAATAPRLRFHLWLNTESAYDCVGTWITTDGVNFAPLAGPSLPYNSTEDGADCWAGNQLQWTQVEFDLAAYAGQTVRIAFAMYSDPYVHYRGAYIDSMIVAEPSMLP